MQKKKSISSLEGEKLTGINMGFVPWGRDPVGGLLQPDRMEGIWGWRKDVGWGGVGAAQCYITSALMRNPVAHH